MDYSCTKERLITFNGGTLSGVAEASLPQWFRRLRAEEDVLTELDGPAYPHALLAEGWQWVDEWHSPWPPPCDCGHCSGRPFTVGVWQLNPGGILYADFSDAHNALYRLAVALADYPAFQARFRELDADKFDEPSQAAEP